MVAVIPDPIHAEALLVHGTQTPGADTWSLNECRSLRRVDNQFWTRKLNTTASFDSTPLRHKRISAGEIRLVAFEFGFKCRGELYTSTTRSKACKQSMASSAEIDSWKSLGGKVEQTRFIAPTGKALDLVRSDRTAAAFTLFSMQGRAT